MKPKLKNIFSCSKCGAQFSKWNGRCLECGGWGTLTKDIVSPFEQANKQNVAARPADSFSLAKIKADDYKRLKTDIGELDRVLGGGFVSGSLLLLAGEPGIGKSTLLAQLAYSIAKNNKASDKKSANVLYVSGEESAPQVKSRFERLKSVDDSIYFAAETNVEKIIASSLKLKPKLMIVDSIQTVYSASIDSEAGSISQIRAATVSFLEMAKTNNITVIITGHVTKDGQVAGPKSLEHIVDTVIYLEHEQSHQYRILRAVKNRFGSVNEIGIFEMSGQGFLEIKNPSSVFLDGEASGGAGTAISCVIEGSRSFLTEVQALTSKTVFGYPQRKTSGFDLNRLQVLSAVLAKRAGLKILNQDIILNIVGGLKLSDPALDLAVCAAIISSLQEKIIDKKTIIIGEVGLGGELRKIAKTRLRLKEAARLGFDKAIIPDDSENYNFISTKKIDNIVNLLGLLK